jgi:hypothetical protein
VRSMANISAEQRLESVRIQQRFEDSEELLQVPDLCDAKRLKYIRRQAKLLRAAAVVTGEIQQ